MYDSLYGLATRSTHPWLTQHTVKTGTSIYQPRPTLASRNDWPAAFNDSTDLSYQQQSSSRTYQLLTSPIELKTNYNRHRLYIHVCNSGNKSSLLLYLLSCLCSLHCLWLSLLARIKLKIIAGSTCISAPQQVLLFIEWLSYIPFYDAK